MQPIHQPASNAFTTTLQRIRQRTESMLQRRIDGGRQAPAEPEAEDVLAGLEVQDSDWGAWVEAGGDLLMGAGGAEPVSELGAVGYGCDSN